MPNRKSRAVFAQSMNQPNSSAKNKKQLNWTSQFEDIKIIQDISSEFLLKNGANDS